MTMNTRQAGAFTELIKKEEAARERWYATHGAAFAARNETLKQAKLKQLQATQSQAQLNGSSSARTNTFANGLSGTSYGSQSARSLSSTFSSTQGAGEDPFANPAVVTRREVHTQEVPYVRQVAVPVRTTKVVEVMVPKQVATTKLIPTPSARRYTPVQQLVTVQVPEDREALVEGYRVDEVEETKLVEQEELRQYTLQPVPTGRVEVLTQRELGTTGRRLARRSGSQVYEESDPRVATLPREPDTPSAYRLRSASSSRPGSARLSQGFDSQRFSQSQPLQQTQYGLPGAQRLGFKVRVSSSNPGTCVVFDVESGAAAQRSGLKAGDVILSTNGRQTASLQDFKNAVAGSRGPLLLQVRRGTDRFVITLQR